jgi:hypothetical protein
MAIFQGTTITNNASGDTNVSLTEQSGDFDRILNNLSNQAYVIRSLIILTDNFDQLDQPVTIVYTNLDGEEKEKIAFPVPTASQYQNVMVVDFDKLIGEPVLWDGSLKIKFNVKANSFVQVKIVTDPFLDDRLDSTKQIINLYWDEQEEAFGLEDYDFIGSSKDEFGEIRKREKAFKEVERKRVLYKQQIEEEKKKKEKEKKKAKPKKAIEPCQCVLPIFMIAVAVATAWYIGTKDKLN